MSWPIDRVAAQGAIQRHARCIDRDGSASGTVSVTGFVMFPQHKGHGIGLALSPLFAASGEGAGVNAVVDTVWRRFPNVVDVIAIGDAGCLHFTARVVCEAAGHINAGALLHYYRAARVDFDSATSGRQSTYGAFDQSNESRGVC